MWRRLIHHAIFLLGSVSGLIEETALFGCVEVPASFWTDSIEERVEEDRFEEKLF